MYLKKGMLAVTILFAVSSYAQTSKLVLNKGEKYEVTATADFSSIASVIGQEIENKSAIMNVETFEVKNVSASQSDLVATVTRLVANMSAMGQETKYDSDKKDNSGPGSEEMGKSVNRPRKVTIDIAGRILQEDKFEGVGGMTMMEPASNSGASLIREDLIGKVITNGNSWDDSVSIKGDKIDTRNVGVFTVKKIDNNIATITYAGTSTVSGFMEQMGQEMEMQSTSKVTGEIKLDITTGIIQESSTTTDGNMIVETAGMSIPVTLKTINTVKVKKL